MDTLGAAGYKKARHAYDNPETVLPPTPAAAASAARASQKRYADAFKRQAVEHWLRSDRPGTQIARELGVSYPSLKEWKRRYHGEVLPGGADLAAENRALKAELLRVRQQRDILKKTLGILSEPSPSATSASKA
ncbi:MAG: transposase [Verrucomicrobia bacterium]|nr:transposase [Verrucomicrobiota bacterium]